MLLRRTRGAESSSHTRRFSREVTGLCQDGLGTLVAWPVFGALHLDAAQDHGQFGSAHAHLGPVCGREAERTALQAPDVECEAVPLPGQDLQPIAAAILEDEEI